jgi:membrane fusion protein, multidrug efflux system
MKKATLCLIPFSIWLAGCGEPPEAPTPAQPQAVAVHVVTANIEQWPTIYEATGTVRARTSAIISAKWMGYVREVKVQVGDRVREGQLLVALDARDLDASANRAAAARDEVRNAIPEADSAVAAAKASLDLAQSTFKRMNELYEKKSISDQEFDEASAKRKAAQAAFEMARAKRSQLDAKLAQAGEEVRATQVTRSYAEVQAPFAGIVTAKSVDPGNLATPGAPLLTIERDGYRLEASVEESKLSSIRLGQPVSVTLDGINHTFDARVSEIVPAVDAASRAYTVKIDLPGEPSLRSGIFGHARFRLGSRQVLAIPFAAVSERGQLQSVFVEEQGVEEHGLARTRLITLGDKSKDEVEVLSGLSAGDKVILPVPQGLADGARVEVAP